MAKRKRRRNQDEGSPGFFHGLYDTVTGAPLEFTHGILDEADTLLGTGATKPKKNRNPKKRRIGRASTASKRKTSTKTGIRKGSHARRGATKKRKNGRASISTLKGGRRMTTLEMVRALPKKTVRKVRRSVSKNPKGQHVAGLAPKYQRMYEDIVKSPGAKERYGPRLKEVAARTARKAAEAGVNPQELRRANRNPGFWPSLLGRRRSPGHIETGKRGKGSKAIRRAKKKGLYRGGSHGEPGYFTRRKTSREPAMGLGHFRKLPNGRFNEFRGREGKSSYNITAANGTPKQTKEAGGLEEMTIGGKLIHGNNGRPRIQGGKILRFNRHKHKLLYRGNNLYLGGIKMGSRNGNPPDRETEIGKVTSITYWADKPHLDHPKTEPYEHFFGDEGGKPPKLICDTEGLPFFSGGSYRISPDGIVN